MITPALYLSLIVAIGSYSGPDIVSTNEKPSRQVNITSDSQPGWLPSEDQEKNAVKAVSEFYVLQETGKNSEAYAMMAEINRQQMPFETFQKSSENFNNQAGQLIKRNLVKITWTKDPANAPFPGIYAAIDIASRFDNVDRQCGYIVLYQKTANSPFEVMREENNYIDNTTANSIVKTDSKAALEKLWEQMSANCPNYTIK